MLLSKKTIMNNVRKIRTGLQPALVLSIVMTISHMPLAHADEKTRKNQQQGSASSRSNDAKAQFGSVDEATAYIHREHPGAKIVKVVRGQRDDGVNVARFRILTADGRMKNISLTVE